MTSKAELLGGGSCPSSDRSMSASGGSADRDGRLPANDELSIGDMGAEEPNTVDVADESLKTLVRSHEIGTGSRGPAAAASVAMLGMTGTAGIVLVDGADADAPVPPPAAEAGVPRRERGV